MKCADINMQSFKETKNHFLTEMNMDWDIKEKFLNKKQKQLIDQIVNHMSDEEGNEWYMKWYNKYRLNRISTAFWRCYNKSLRFIQKERMIDSYLNGEDKLPRGLKF